MRIVCILGRVFGAGPEGPSYTRQYVFRVREASEAENSMMSRIIELADGKSMGEISEVLYSEEVRAGDWVADIGFWRNLFYRDVIETIGELVRLSYLRVELSEKAKEEQSGDQ